MSNRTPTKRSSSKRQVSPPENKHQQKNSKRKEQQKQSEPEIVEQKPVEEVKEDPVVKPENIFSKYIIIPCYYEENPEPKNVELKFDINVDITESNELDALRIVLCDNEDIFFCMKSAFKKRDFEKIKNKERYNCKYEEIPGLLIQMLESFMKQEPDFLIYIEMHPQTCTMYIQQRTNLFIKELIHFQFEHVSEEESDLLAQQAYLLVRTRLLQKKEQLDIYMTALMKKNPDIYNDIQINGMDYIHTPEEKKRALEHFLEKDEKVAARIAELERKNLGFTFKTNKKLMPLKDQDVEA